MIGANPFFKRPEPMATNFGSDYLNKKGRIAHNNHMTRPFDGHPRYGFQTMLNHDSFAALPTAPPVVGGNVDWTQSKVSPASRRLHSFLAERRSMNPAPALGTPLKLGEPSRDSIHTNF
jgi:hypothetical protein